MGKSLCRLHNYIDVHVHVDVDNNISVVRTKQSLSFCLLCFINGIFTEALNSTFANNRKKLNTRYINCKLEDSPADLDRSPYYCFSN